MSDTNQTPNETPQDTSVQSESPPAQEWDDALEPTAEIPAAEPPETADPVPTEAAAPAPYVPSGVKHQNIVNVPPESITAPLPEGQAPGFFMAMPSASSEVVEEALNQIPPNTVKSEVWSQVLTASNAISTDGEFSAALSNPNNQWSPQIDYKGKRFGSQPQRAASIAGREVSGDQAIMAFRSNRNGVSGSRILFYGSGLSVRLNKLSKTALYEISSSIGGNRITAGRSSYGMALSQHMTYTIETFLEALRMARISSSVKDEVDLGDAIRVTDFSTLVWGLTTAIWPQGFEIARGCIASPDTCDHVTHDVVNVNRQQLIKVNNITDAQREILANPKENIQTLEDLATYQTLFANNPGNEFTFKDKKNGDVTFIMKVPTLNEAIAAGKLWIDEVAMQVARTIGQESSIEERQKMFNELMYLTTARQYSHWVERISYAGGFTQDQKAIREILSDTISADEELAEFFIKSVNEYHQACVGALIVLPNFKCPVCRKWQMVEEGQDPEGDTSPKYEPIDTVMTFLGLMSHTLSA